MTTFDYFLRKYFGARGKRLVRTLVVCAVVYGGLAATEWRVAISPFVLCLMTSVFSGGAMLRALAAADGQTELRHLLMLPENAHDIVRGYIGALALYTLATKTLPLLSLLLAVSRWSAQTLCSVVFCALCSVLLAALFRSGLRWLAALWMLALFVVLRLCTGARVLLPLLALSAAAALILLARADAWAFLRATPPGSRSGKHAQHFLMLRYFLRHLFTHRNYLVNTAGLWLVAAALPFFFASFAREIFVAPLGFAILTLNTPLSVLLSADPTLDRACLPYVVLLAGANLLADTVFLISWTLTIGPVTPPMLAAAGFIALQSALAAVWLEWQHPLKNWRSESDLWHHPRKYLVPAVMLLLAAAIGSWPILPLCWIVLAAEGVVAGRCLMRG